jgi:hypothetical protein
MRSSSAICVVLQRYAWFCRLDPSVAKTAIRPDLIAPPEIAVGARGGRTACAGFYYHANDKITKYEGNWRDFQNIKSVLK